MRRLVTYLLIAIMMVGTIGIDKSVHYCNGEFIGFETNGFTYKNEKGKMMSECMNEHSHCKHCKIIYNSYRIPSSLIQGVHVNTQPLLSYRDWLHGDLYSILDTLLLNLKDNKEDYGLYHLSLYLSLKIPITKGLRAPPVVA
ncbi:MAG: hypothetical protein WCR36_10360 [Bacteroidaceae bacterium]|nr:hypothetical protein [Prevotella sp.]